MNPAPDSPDALLADYGLDSLMTAMAILELQDEFGVKIPQKAVTPENFESLSSLAALLGSLGAGKPE